MKWIKFDDDQPDRFRAVLFHGMIVCDNYLAEIDVMGSVDTSGIKTDRDNQIGFIEFIPEKWAYVNESSPVKTAEEDIWISVNNSTPVAYEKGNWDGLRSELVFVLDKDLLPGVARVYEGILDGNRFISWYDNNDFEIPSPKYWKSVKYNTQFK